MAEKAAIVLFSGGQDSTVCLAWALARYDRVETIGFDYGQRHRVELAQRQVILEKLRVRARHLGPDTMLALPALSQVSDTALTRDTEIAFARSGLPTTFVPGRNILFLTYAAALAYRRGVGALVAGMCETDFSGYPDCRDATIRATARALTLGLELDLAIETPLMFVDKAGTWAMAQALGGEDLVALVVEDTHTCYLGNRTIRQDWGYGCGGCPACELRAAGWHRWRAATLGASTADDQRPGPGPGRNSPARDDPV